MILNQALSLSAQISFNLATGAIAVPSTAVVTARCRRPYRVR